MAFFERRGHILFAPHQNYRLRQAREGRLGVCVEVAGKERCDGMLRSGLVAGGVKICYQSIGDAAMIVKRLVAGVVSYTCLTGSLVKERRPEEGRLKQKIERSPGHAGPPG